MPRYRRLRLELLEDRTVPTAVGAFDPASATWLLRSSAGPGNPDAGQFAYGGAGSIPVVGDWDGDGTEDLGVVDPASMTWQLHFGTAAGNPDAGVFQYGPAGSTPVVGDWDGDGDDDIGVVTPDLVWLLHFGAGPGNPDAGVFQYGPAGSTPVVGDWDGDGVDGIAAVTPDLVWLLRPTAAPGNPDDGVFQYGGRGSRPVAGDWLGDGAHGIGVVSPGLVWQLRSFAGGGDPDAGVFQYGGAGSVPVVGDFAFGGSGSTGGGFDVDLRFLSPLTPSQQAIFQAAAIRWQSILVGDLPNATFRGIAVDDILIDVTTQSIDGPNGTLGFAGPDALRRRGALPFHATMTFDTADVARLESRGRLLDVVLHEMAHAFGFGTIWTTLGLLQGEGTADERFLGPRAVAEYNAIFATNAAGVPVEDGHFRESVFRNELMTPTFDSTFHPLSRVTVASLADLGYLVDLDAADAFSPR